jgi:hypothetical protein
VKDLIKEIEEQKFKDDFNKKESDDWVGGE